MSSSVRRRLPRRSGNNLLVSVLLGGAIGCGLLALLGVIAFVVINGILHADVTPTPGGGAAVTSAPTNTNAPLTRGTATTRPALELRRPPRPTLARWVSVRRCRR